MKAGRIIQADIGAVVRGVKAGESGYPTWLTS